MIRNRYLLFVLAVLVCSCESVDLSSYLGNGDGEGFRTTFVMNVITQSDFEDSGSRTVKNVSDVATVINFAVFKDGEKVKTVNKKSTDDGFGTVSLSLPEGTYQVVAVAHRGEGNATVSSPEKVSFANNKVTDTFCFYKEITVDSQKEYDAQMTRVVAMFRMQIEQDIPSEVTQMKFYYTGGSSTLDATTGFGCVNSRQTELRSVASHASGQVFEVYTFPHDTEGSLKMTISALTSSGDTWQEKLLDNVPVTIRRITTYKGQFFVEGQANSASIFPFMADDSWAGEDEYEL